MLFRTVYGLELPAIYQLIWNLNSQGYFPQKADILELLYSDLENGNILQTQTVDDAISFLSSAKLLDAQEGLRACFDPQQKSFGLQLLEQLTLITRKTIEPEHPLDPLFLFLLNELFIIPDRQYISNVHNEANQLKEVKHAGGISKEKIQAWKRVLEFIGLGYRIHSGFLCSYNPALVKEIIHLWDKDHGTLQDFLETQFSKYIPFSTKDGEISNALATTLRILEKTGDVSLLVLQDSPARFYFRDQKIRGISKEVKQ